mmetsp:Transcript_11447/g.22470  ORF Transcript_11447/g.22470 Transcript_11447/m.22470 type:complete len:94 (-) Transcript_11447:39-320(-)
MAEDCTCGESLTFLGGFCKTCAFAQLSCSKLSSEQTAKLKKCFQEGAICEKCFNLDLTSLELFEKDDCLVFACPQCHSVESTMSTLELIELKA